MARRITFSVDFDLAKGSKEAHAVTIEKLAKKVGDFAMEIMEAHHYKVEKAVVSTQMHYVRHSFAQVLRKPKLKIIKKVS